MKLEKLAFGFIFFILSLFFSASIAKASVIFQDDFSDGNLDGWTVQRNECYTDDLPSEWKVQNNKIGIKINGGSCVTEISPDTWNGSLSDYQIELDMDFVSGTDKNLAFRYVSPDQWYDIKFD